MTTHIGITIRYDGLCSTIPPDCPLWSVLRGDTDQLIGEIVNIGSDVKPSYEAWRTGSSQFFDKLSEAALWLCREAEIKEPVVVFRLTQPGKEA